MSIAEELDKKKKTSEAIKEFALEYKEKNKAAAGNEKEALKDKLRQIREYSITSIDALRKKAATNMAANGFIVHEAKDAEEAVNIIKEIAGHEKHLVKAKSNTLDEIGLKEKMEHVEVVETDLGDFINSISGNADIHPVLPALNLTPEDIADAIKKRFHKKIDATPEAIAEFAREHIRSKISEAKTGLSGANAITSEGQVILLENEGNISLVSRMPDKHIIVAGIDKFVNTIEDAMHIVKCASIWATGQKWPSYVSIISGPSKTADIQNKLIIGAQGAKEAHVILLDNGRSRMIQEGFAELLQCIGCGACLDLCPAYHQLAESFGCDTIGGIRGVASNLVKKSKKDAFEAGAFYCFTCQSCKINCPAKIDLPKHMLKIREILAKEGMEPEKAKEMAATVRQYGNPFGVKGESPKELYCC